MINFAEGKKELQKDTFLIWITYFTRNGTYVKQARFVDKFQKNSAGMLRDINHVASKVRGWRDCGGQGALPGMGPEDPEGWDGYILLECDEGDSPCLILPPG